MAIKTELDHLREWSLAVADVKRKLKVATDYRDKQIALRDRKASQISLSEREERMWQNRIDSAQAVVDRLERQLRLLNN